MEQRIRAVFSGGAFVPQQPCQLAEGTRVELEVHAACYLPPTIRDPQARQALLKELTARMLANPIFADAPHFTREELHDRR